ncbi:MAG: HAMP domain-containing sensor histidine kinase, partial [Planctomycetota bacterium]
MQSSDPMNLAAIADDLYEAHHTMIARRMDRVFSGLLLLQYVAGIVAALVISPRTWVGTESGVHPHVLAALVLGGLIIVFPFVLARTRPGEILTRHTIAVAQVLFSALLIHLTGGRIETHFHIFGSLAFLSFYRDWRVLVSASIVVAIDHLVRGLYFPQSVYGVIAASEWRWIEHAGWVLFEDIFLVRSCVQGVREMKEIAERRALTEIINEELYEQKLRAEAASAAKTEFLANMSHELRTPLHGILSFAALGERRSNDEEKSKSYFERIGVSGGTLLRLLNDVLDVAKIESGKFQIEPSECNVGGIVDGVLAEFGSIAGDRQIEIRHNSSGELDVEADPVRLAQVVRNLVSNAVKFTPEDSVVRVEVWRSGNSVSLCVEDQGPGIPEEELEAVFEEFVQSSVTKTGAGGTGLGLAISREIASAHGGQLWGQNVEDGGAKFVLEIPLRPVGETVAKRDEELA